MGAIVCATRGGEGSRAAQLKAVERAKEGDHHLIFLYVVDVHMVGQFDDNLQSAVRAEFHWLGKSLLHVAQQRAERAGISADNAIRDGSVKEEIERFLRESEADVLMLGAPRGTSPVFGDDAIEHFAQEIEDDTGVPVELIRPEDVPERLGELESRVRKSDSPAER